MSMELPEDDPILGASDLRSLESNDTDQHILLIGISCGLSAPYVMGQIQHAMSDPRYNIVLMGFNSAEFARDRTIEKWKGHSCLSIVQELHRKSQTSVCHSISNSISHRLTSRNHRMTFWNEMSTSRF